MSRVALIACLVLFAPAFVGAQAPTDAPPPPAPKDPPTFQGNTQVLVVQVPVTVTDRDGKPARGLTAADFELYDEGERQPVSGFEMVDLARLAGGDERRERLVAELPSAARRHFLLLFDLSFSDPTSVVRARLAAREFALKQLHPTDLAAVATFSAEHGPRLLVTFTPDRAQLARAIDTLGVRGLLARNAADPLRFMIEAPGANVSGADLIGGEARAEGSNRDDRRAAVEASVNEHLQLMARQFDRSTRRSEVNRITNWSRAFADLGRALDSVQGRKQVVLFSEGFDSRLLLGRGPSAGDSDAEADNQAVLLGRQWQVDSDQLYGSTELQGELAGMLESLKRADCVIQAVDIGGLRAGADLRDRLGNAGQDGLFYLANETGGRLYKDANVLDTQLSDLLEQTSVTYLLAFQPSKVTFDGKFHRLRVKLAEGRGLRVTHRAGFYMPRPYGELHPLERNLLASDAIASAQPRQDLKLSQLAVPFMASESSAYVPVIVEIDGESLLQAHQGPRMPVEIYSYVTNEKGEMRDFFTDLVTIDTDKGRDALTSTGLKYYGHLDLGPGRFLIRTLVRSGSTGRSGMITTDLVVPHFTAAQSVLLPPLFLESPGTWVLARETQDQTRQQTVIYPFTLKGDPFIPSARPTLRAGNLAHLCLVAYNLGAGELEISGRVLTAEGEEIPGGELSLVERTATGINGLDKLVATFLPEGVANGQYTLEVRVADRLRGSEEVSSIPFSVLD